MIDKKDGKHIALAVVAVLVCAAILTCIGVWVNEMWNNGWQGTALFVIALVICSAIDNLVMAIKNGRK